MKVRTELKAGVGNAAAAAGGAEASNSAVVEQANILGSGSNVHQKNVTIVNQHAVAINVGPRC